MMPAGKYYVGDLCYVMHPEWDEFCDLTIKDHKVIDGEFNLADGRRFATYKTAYGDGSYECSDGSILGVDAGLIGCILVDDIKEEKDEEELRRLGTIVEFEHPFHTDSDGAVIEFGDITVDTDPPFEEDEEPADEYEWDDDED